MKEYQNHPAFRKMDAQKQKLIIQLVNSLADKKLAQAMPVILAWQKQMRDRNISFTPEENRLLTDIFTAQMTPAQRKQYESLRHFMK